MKSVKLRGTLAFAVAIGFLMCTSCGYNFVQQDISIGSWANANNNP